MSGLAGIYNLDGRPVDPALLTRMTEIIAHRGPDGVGHWIDGSVGLGHRMLHTTPESLQETQPLCDETGNLCLVLDGRVDNRGELKAALGAKGMKLRTDTDAEIVLRAYECWGEECPRRIIGDFAFVIWDRRNRQLFCARDPLGIKPFYYSTDGRTFLFGSELRQLFEAATVRREPNEGMIGEYLACAITDQEETLYRGILRLPLAHFLIIQPGRIRKERYWDIDPAREIRCRTDEEYAEHFLEIFTEAVRCRLRSHKPVGVALSGGLDSASIVGVAQSLYRKGVLTDLGFETFSLVFPGLSCDESSYIQDVVQMWGIKSNALSPKDSNALCYAEHVQRYYDFPDYPNTTLWDPLKTLAREKGCRVLLTGFGGDEWLTGSFYHYADLLRELRILALIRQVRLDRRQACFGMNAAIIFPSFPVLRYGVWPLLPRTARHVIRWVLRRNRGPHWMHPRFARRIRLSERLREVTGGPQFSSLAQRQAYSMVTSGWCVHSLEMEERSEAWFHLEGRHPFNDRRVVEFALTLPEEQRWRRDQPKFILRQAMQGLLPETIRNRLTKSDFSHAFAEALKALGGERFCESLTIASMGWVDGEKSRGIYRRMAQLYARGDEEYTSYVWPAWMICGIELLFNTVFSKSEAVPPEARRIQGGENSAGLVRRTGGPSDDTAIR